MDFKVRKANLNDRRAIEQLIARSVRGLSKEYYAEDQIEAALLGIFGLDTDLIVDQTYFIAEHSEMLVGCGGWSRRKTLFGGDKYPTRDASRLNPATDSARIRAFFVHPDFARRGVGRAILAQCEAEARAEGFASLELLATLSGLDFYRSCGYTGDEFVEYEAVPGLKMKFLPMKKWL
jgi:N-acetylglutamate synthase-like GNAT family acetyltransferase